MTSLNNLEKLIQIAMIEQMYTMLNKWKEHTLDNKECILEHNEDNFEHKEDKLKPKEEQNSKECFNSGENDKAITTIYEQIRVLDDKNGNVERHLLSKIHDTDKRLNKNDELFQQFMLGINKRFETYDSELKEMKSIIDNQSLTIEHLQKNMSSQQTADERIILKIEEKQIVSDDRKDEEQVEEEEAEQEAEQEEEEEEEEVEEEVEEEEEEEVGTEDDELVDTKKEEKEEEVVEEVVEEEEEVFEIEIDDVTYFATHEENGLLYEVDANGDVGKKVGYIKDGEPIFN